MLFDVTTLGVLIRPKPLRKSKREWVFDWRVRHLQVFNVLGLYENFRRRDELIELLAGAKPRRIRTIKIIKAAVNGCFEYRLYFVRSKRPVALTSRLASPQFMCRGRDARCADRCCRVGRVPASIRQIFSFSFALD